MKKTPWFKASVKPVRRGVYEQNPVIWKERYCYWDGHHWWLPCPVVDGAKHSANDGYSKPRAWRGLMR